MLGTYLGLQTVNRYEVGLVMSIVKPAPFMQAERGAHGEEGYDLQQLPHRHLSKPRVAEL